MRPSTVLWNLGPYSCEVRTIVQPRYVVVTKDGEDVAEVAVQTNLEIEERAEELRGLLHARERAQK